MDTYGI